MLQGCHVIQVNTEFNEARPDQEPINRYVLITSGEAVVGNLGGFDSSIEITALGNPVNFLSRIDEATKHPAIRSMITNRHIVMDEGTAMGLGAILPGFEVEHVDLASSAFTFATSKASIGDIPLFRVRPLNAKSTNMQLRGLVSTDVTDPYGSNYKIQTVRS